MRVKVLVSQSAKLTKSLRGAKALIAKTSVKVADEDHESSIKKGEKFYIKKLGSKYYLIDMEGKDLYQFAIDEKKYKQLEKKHQPVDAELSSKKPQGNILVRTTNPAKQKAVEELVLFSQLEKSPKVKAYKKAQIEHRKSSTFPNRALKTEKLAKEMKKLAKDKDVKAYLKIAAKGMTDVDKVRSALTKHDPEFAKIEKEIKAAEKRNDRTGAIVASGKLERLVRSYKKSN